MSSRLSLRWVTRGHTRDMRPVFLLGLLVFAASCGLAPRQHGGDILIIGDSVMAWNRSAGADIGRALEAELGRDVVNRAALGAQIRADDLSALGGLSIPDQLSAGPWTWVVMNGGANDLGFSCGCIRCDAEIDLLISQDATTGAIPDLIARARAQGAKVLWAGYYKAPDTRAFRGCRPGLVELERRIAIHARTREGVFFVDTEDVLDPARPDLLDTDRTHPSVEGSAVIGRFLAREIAAHSQR
jgi:acyl-CoA thioesterase I